MIKFIVFTAFLSLSFPAFADLIHHHNEISTPSEAKKEEHCYYIKKYNKKNKHHYFVRECSVDEATQQHAKTHLEKKKSLQEDHYGVSFYQPTYVLPFYYTGRTYNSVYQGETPNNQRVLNEEFKAYLSFKFPIWLHIFNSKLSLNMYYNQLSYWQFYANSQYFRETDYEPALYFSYRFAPQWHGWLGAVHQSNGRGGKLERSWNRLFVDIIYTRGNFLLSIRPWVLIFKKHSSDLHNPNIDRFLGHERIVIAYQFYGQEISLMLRNTFESGFHRGAIELSYAFPIHGVLHGYIQFFSGYGQSLIEYDHYTNSVGVGISINNWI